jgi:hypothetical protein
MGASQIASQAGVVALLTTPLLLVGLSSHSTDASSLAWMLIAGGLIACSREQPLLLVPAVLAAALSIGTRTQSAPVLVALAIWALVIHRSGRTLRPYRKHLTAAALLAILIGAFWYLRNIASHGSPLWPTVGTPWGDPRATYFDNAPRFFEQPLGYLTHVLNHRVKSGGIPLLVVGMVTPLLTRRTAARFCALVAGLGTALWMFTPFSGETDFATTRYLFPVMAASMAGLVLAGGTRGWLLIATILFLLASAAWNMFQLTGPIDGFVHPIYLVAGASAGGLIAYAVPERWPAKLLSAPAILRAAVVAACLTALLIAFAPGFLQRHLEIESERARTNTVVPLARWLSGQRSFINEGDTVAMTWSLYGPLTGDRLQHPLVLLKDDAPCATFDNHAARDWLLLRRSERGKEVPGYRRARECLRERTPVYDSEEYTVFSDRQTESP